MTHNIPLSSAKVKQILNSFNLKPNKLLGQNFLIDQHILQKIIEGANLTKNDVVLEIGPGLGILTKALVQRSKKVIAIEKDPKMVKVLKEILGNFKNLEIIEGDALKTNFKLLISNDQLNPNDQILKNYKIVANLPYYITSPLIRKFLETEHGPELMVLMVQKEVAQRICAAPPNMNLLAVSVQFYAKPEIISYVKKTSFWPRPRIDSAVLRINPRPERALRASRGATLFFKIARAGFKQPRKQLLGNLANGLGLPKEAAIKWLSLCGIQPTQRAETLSIENWKKLAENFKKK